MSTGEAAGQQGQGDGDGQAAEQQAPDWGSMSQTLEQQGQSLEQLRDMMQGFGQQFAQQQEPQGEEQQADDLPELGFLETGDPQFDQELASNLDNLIKTQVERGVQQHLNPLQERLQTFERMDQARELVAEFPELNEQDHAQRVIGMSREYAEMMGEPQLADNPQMWRLMHLANAAMVAAKEEGDQSPAAHIEGAGGAGAGQQPQVDLGDLIVNGGGEDQPLGRRALPF